MHLVNNIKYMVKKSWWMFFSVMIVTFIQGLTISTKASFLDYYLYIMGGMNAFNKEAVSHSINIGWIIIFLLFFISYYRYLEHVKIEFHYKKSVMIVALTLYIYAFLFICSVVVGAFLITSIKGEFNLMIHQQIHPFTYLSIQPNLMILEYIMTPTIALYAICMLLFFTRQFNKPKLYVALVIYIMLTPIFFEVLGIFTSGIMLGRNVELARMANEFNVGFLDWSSFGIGITLFEIAFESSKILKR